MPVTVTPAEKKCEVGGEKSKIGGNVEFAPDDRMCRICLDSSEESHEDLISPCHCKGSQMWVHLTCLRKWQRTTMMKNASHSTLCSSFEDPDECTVCKGKFVCPTGRSLQNMLSFEKKDALRFIGRGKLLVPHPCFAAIQRRKRRSELFAPPDHWQGSVYFICKLSRPKTYRDISIENPMELCTFLARFDHMGKAEMFNDRMFLVKATWQPSDDNDAGQLEFPALDFSSERYLPFLISRVFPVVIRLTSKEMSMPDEDMVTAVNLSKPYSTTRDLMSIMSTPQTVMSEICFTKVKLMDRSLSVDNFKVEVYDGGPRRRKTISQCIVLGGKTGFLVVNGIEEAFLEAIKLWNYDGWQHDCKQNRMMCGQTVRLANLKSRIDLNGQIGMACYFEKTSQRWGVRLHSTNELKMIKACHVEVVDSLQPTILAFAGFQRWTRPKLISDIMKGRFGICSGQISDLMAKSNERRDALDSRLVFCTDARQQFEDDCLSE